MPVITPNYSENIDPPKVEKKICKVVKSESYRARNSNNLYISWELLVLPEGSKCYHSTPCEGPAAGRLESWIAAFGLSAPEGKPFDTDVLVGKFALCELEVKKMTGRDGNQLTVYEVLGSERASPEDINQAEKNVRRHQSGSGEIDNEDIQF